MSRKLIIAMAVLAFAFAGSTFAAVENVKVSGDISAQSVLRNLGMGQKEGNVSTKSSEFLMSQIRLRFDADLTEGVSAVLRLISENTWGDSDTAANEQIELDLAYVELKEFIYQPLTLVVGRQNLRYGNGLIVGDPWTNQTGNRAAGLPVIASDLSLRKSFDAVKAILDFAPWTIDLVFAQVEETNAAGVNDATDDEYLFGVNAAYDWSSYNGLTEVYFFGADKTPNSAVTAQIPTKDKVYTVGARGQFDLNDNLTLGLEGAYQFGEVQTNVRDADGISAWAYQLMSEYRFLNDLNTKLGLSYTFLQGVEPNSTDPARAWNALWEDQTPGELINILMSNTNAHLLTITGSMMPREDVTLGMLYTHAELDKNLAAAAYTPTMGPASVTAYVTEGSPKHFGDEVDVYAVYDYTEDVQIKLSSAMFIPGSVFTSANSNLAYSTRLGLNVDF